MRIVVFNQKEDLLFSYENKNGIMIRKDEVLIYFNKKYRVLSVEHCIGVFDNINIIVEEMN